MLIANISFDYGYHGNQKLSQNIVLYRIEGLNLQDIQSSSLKQFVKYCINVLFAINLSCQYLESLTNSETQTLHSPNKKILSLKLKLILRDDCGFVSL